MIIVHARKLLLLAGVILLFSSAGHASDCFKCHEATGFSGKVVHQPVADGDCTICHSPHVSRHKGLLRQAEARLCYSCHEEVAAQVEKKTYLHQPVRQGQCSECHLPHAADGRGLLAKKGSALCYGCHSETQNAYKFTHKPFQRGQCNVCHTAHASDDSRLLKKLGSRLCLDCHKVTARLKKTHLGRDLGVLDCLSCHNPHGGAERKLLRTVSHQPFADRECETCHGQPSGTGLCLGCHEESLASFQVVHSHLGVGGTANACTVCHNPHVGDRPGLLPKNEGRICRSCHADTFARRDNMLHQHANWNSCSDCHQGHGADNPAMLKNGQDVCAQCHERHKAFSHPMGEAALDPRNGKPMDCLTCHEANTGSMFKHFLRGSGERGLCVQCHQSY
ncbi:MAG: hypothetical protein KAT62_04380 [Desulfuromonadales bacterium]|nr:hypothetical protein [Desulfuromonadales bacterium]